VVNSVVVLRGTVCMSLKLVRIRIESCTRVVMYISRTFIHVLATHLRLSRYRSCTLEPGFGSSVIGFFISTGIKSVGFCVEF
jgi:hypothetical protein